MLVWRNLLNSLSERASSSEIGLLTWILAEWFAEVDHLFEKDRCFAADNNYIVNYSCDSIPVAIADYNLI